MKIKACLKCKLEKDDNDFNKNQKWCRSCQNNYYNVNKEIQSQKKKIYRKKNGAKTWNDNDQSTWTWNIDHIIPQSTLPYTSMDDEIFKKCWALENLRPLSQNKI